MSNVSDSIRSIRKRNGKTDAFNEQKISNAIFAALESSPEGKKLANKLAKKVIKN